MKITELHRNDVLRRQAFPSIDGQIYLAHAGVCPIPRDTSFAMEAYVRACTHGDQENFFPLGKISETRNLVGEILNCSEDDIALVGPTSVGLSLVANGLDWKKGDNVVYYPDDYPSNAVVWMALKDQGVELREIETDKLGQIGIPELESVVDGKTKLVSLASAHFISGYRLNLDELGEWIHRKGSLFCVDGIQTIGAISTSIRHVDFLAADAHKWMLGPCAAGILYVRKEVQDRLRPSLVGWNNVICPNYVTPDKVAWKPSARRYEAGSPNLMGLIGMNCSLQLLKSYGWDKIQKTLEEHTRFLRDQLSKKGFYLAGSSDEQISGITSFSHASRDLGALHQKLNQAKIIASLRQTRDGKKWIRFSPHFYNTRAELEEAVKVLG